MSLLKIPGSGFCFDEFITHNIVLGTIELYDMTCLVFHWGTTIKGTEHIRKRMLYIHMEGDIVRVKKSIALYFVAKTCTCGAKHDRRHVIYHHEYNDSITYLGRFDVRRTWMVMKILYISIQTPFKKYERILHRILITIEYLAMYWLNRLSTKCLPTRLWCLLCQPHGNYQLPMWRLWWVWCWNTMLDRCLSPLRQTMKSEFNVLEQTAYSRSKNA